MLPGDELAFALVAVYMGLETMTRLSGGDTKRLRNLFLHAESIAGMINSLGQPRKGARRSGRPQSVVLE